MTTNNPLATFRQAAREALDGYFGAGRHTDELLPALEVAAVEHNEAMAQAKQVIDQALAELEGKKQ